ncbi:MAG: hypothetical protein FWE61_00750 [Micrococcales bacterium]|nr:hypothetical protein [Micrococcales bacterium]
MARPKLKPKTTAYQVVVMTLVCLSVTACSPAGDDHGDSFYEMDGAQAEFAKVVAELE